METPGPEESGSRRSRRRTDIAVWTLVILALIGFAATAAWYLSNASFKLRELTYSDETVELPIMTGDGSETPPAADPDPAPPPRPVSTIGPNGEVLRHPAWVKTPAPVFPRLAMRRGVEQGDVVLRCETLATGEFGACEALNETPPGAGFARAALAATRQARVRPYSIDGFETDSEVTFTVRFRMAPEP